MRRLPELFRIIAQRRLNPPIDCRQLLLSFSRGAHKFVLRRKSLSRQFEGQCRRLDIPPSSETLTSKERALDTLNQRTRFRNASEDLIKFPLGLADLEQRFEPP